MGLQVRLRHAMGEHIYDIPARSADKPLVIGRGAEAGLQVPSMTVAPRQCVLFVKDGQWFAQQWAAGGTRLNGTLLEKPTPLRVGDVLGIGSEPNAATLEIEPGAAAAGRKGNLVRDGVAAPAPTPAAARPAKQKIPPPPKPPAAAAPPPPRPRATAAPMQPDGDTVDWGAPPAPASLSYRKPAPRKKQSSLAAVVVGVLLTMAIAGGTAWFVLRHMQQQTYTVVTIPAPKPVALPSNTPASSQPAAKPQPQTQPTVASANTADDKEEPDPHAGDPDWIDVEVSHNSPNQAAALLKYDDYRRRNPGKNDAILKQYEQEALDRLWWQRIAQLCHRRTRLAGEIEAKTKEINEEGNADYKAKLANDKTALELDLSSTTETLRGEMGCAADDPPNLADDASLTAARAARNPGKYAQWSADTAQYARYHAGQTPWGDEDQ